jgi:hypothetical protein
MSTTILYFMAWASCIMTAVSLSVFVAYQKGKEHGHKESFLEHSGDWRKAHREGVACGRKEARSEIYDQLMDAYARTTQACEAIEKIIEGRE